LQQQQLIAAAATATAAAEPMGSSMIHAKWLWHVWCMQAPVEVLSSVVTWGTAVAAVLAVDYAMLPSVKCFLIAALA
jgi:hypothetical protein